MSDSAPNTVAERRRGTARAGVLAALLALSTAGFGAAGCSDDPGPPDQTADAGLEPDAGTPIFTSDELCGRYATAQCDLLARCFTPFNRLEKEDCVRQQVNRCLAQTRAVAVSVSDGRARLDVELADSCIERMTDSSCQAALAPTAVASGGAVRAFDECSLDRLFVGNVERGQICQSRNECQTGNDCIIFAGTCGGVCTPFYGIGEVCNGGGCDPAVSFCDTQTSTCTPLRPEGGGCDSAAECAADLDCRGGQCLPAPPVFAPCVFSAARLPYCAAGLACDVAPYVETSGECVTRKAEGEGCAFHWSCKAGLVCSGMDWAPFPDAPPGRGVCRKPRKEGESCSFTQFAIYVGEECAPGLTCDATTETCVPRPHEGERCSLQAQNCIGEGIFCKPEETGGGICGLAPGIGEGCNIDLGEGQFPLVLPCRDGYCDPDSDVCTPANASEGEPCTADTQCLTGRCVVQQDKSLKCGKRCD